MGTTTGAGDTTRPRLGRMIAGGGGGAVLLWAFGVPLLLAAAGLGIACGRARWRRTLLAVGIAAHAAAGVALAAATGELDLRGPRHEPGWEITRVLAFALPLALAFACGWWVARRRPGAAAAGVLAAVLVGVLFPYVAAGQAAADALLRLPGPGAPAHAAATVERVRAVLTLVVAVVPTPLRPQGDVAAFTSVEVTAVGGNCVPTPAVPPGGTLRADCVTLQRTCPGFDGVTPVRAAPG